MNIFEQAGIMSEANIKAQIIARDFWTQRGNKEILVIMNVNLFAAICGYDLICYYEDLKKMEPSWKKSLQARNAVILLVEYVATVGRITGKEFRSVINDNLTDEADIEYFNQLCKQLDVFRKKHNAELIATRNQSAAHREPDSSSLLSAILDVDAEEVLLIVGEIMQWNNKLVSFLTKIMNTVADATT